MIGSRFASFVLLIVGPVVLYLCCLLVLISYVGPLVGSSELPLNTSKIEVGLGLNICITLISLLD